MACNLGYLQAIIVFNSNVSCSLQPQPLRYLQHPLDRLHRFLRHFLIHQYLRRFILQTLIELLQRIQPHEATLVTCTRTIVGRSGDKRLLRAFLLHLMQDSRFGSNNELLCTAVYCMFQQGGGRSNKVGKFQDCAFAFGVCKYDGIGILSFQLHNLLYRELLMHMAGTIPQ